MDDAKKRAVDRGTVATNIVVILIALGIVVQTDSSLIEWWRDRADEAETEESIDGAWEALVGEGGALGSRETAQKVLVEFGDYQCPYCRFAHQVVDSLVAADSSLVLVYRHLPLTQMHPLAEEAARASICAEQAGRFEAVHRFLYEDLEWETISDRSGILDRLRKLTPVEFSECMASVTTSERLARDIALATKLGVRSTPTFVGRRGIHVGVPQPDDIDRILGR